MIYEITAKHITTGKTVTLYYPSIAKASKNNKYLKEFVLRGVSNG